MLTHQIIVKRFLVAAFLAQTTSVSAQVRGDFDGDGFADLAIGAPGGLGANILPGDVHVLYGTADGPHPNGDQLWNQDTPGIHGEGGGGFGAALAVGDFDNDGFSDLAIGVPGDMLGQPRDQLGSAGSVNVLYGKPAGLTTNRNQHWHQNSNGIRGRATGSEVFGSAVCSGDFDGDGFDDLAIGVPNERFGDNIPDGGAVNVLYGSADGLHKRGNQSWHQDQPYVNGIVEDEDRFGASLASADFNNDGFDDLAIGVPGESFGLFGFIKNAGAVNVLYGTASGLRARHDQLWHQDRPGIIGRNGRSDRFGTTLAAGDFDGDGYGDLAIGVPGETIGIKRHSGAVAVIYGSRNGLRSSGDQRWHKDKSGVRGNARIEDQFGMALVVDDFDGDGFDDMAVGAKGSLIRTGTVNVLYGTGSGLRAADDQIWKPANVPGQSTGGFGRRLGTGDFNGDGYAELLIGRPGRFNLNRNNRRRYEHGDCIVLFGSMSGVTNNGAQQWMRDSPGVKGIGQVGDGFGSAFGR